MKKFSDPTQNQPNMKAAKGPLTLKRIYKQLKKNPNSSAEEIQVAKAAYLAAKSTSSNKRKRNEEAKQEANLPTLIQANNKRHRPTTSTPSYSLALRIYANGSV